MAYQLPHGPVVSTGVVAVGGLTLMHSILLAVTVMFTLYVIYRIVLRVIAKMSR